MARHRTHTFSGHGDIDRDPRSHLLLDLVFATERPSQAPDEVVDGEDPNGGADSAREPSSG